MADYQKSTQILGQVDYDPSGEQQATQIVGQVEWGVTTTTTTSTTTTSTTTTYEFFDDFETGDASKWDASGGTPTFLSGLDTWTDPRFGTYQIFAESADYVDKNLPESDEYYASFYWHPGNAFYDFVITFMYNTTVLGAVRYYEVNEYFYAMAGAVTLATSGTTWKKSLGASGHIAKFPVYVEFYYKIADTGGRFVLKADGVTIFDITGDTKPGSETVINKIRIGHSSSFGSIIDNIKVSRTQFPGYYREWRPSSFNVDFEDQLLDDWDVLGGAVDTGDIVASEPGFGGSYNLALTGYGDFLAKVVAPTDEIFFDFKWKWDGSASARIVTFKWGDSNLVRFGLDTTSDEFYLLIGASVEDSIAAAFATTPRRFQIHLKIHDTNGFVKIWDDQKRLILSFNGDTTTGRPSALVDNLIIGDVAGYGLEFDDIKYDVLDWPNGLTTTTTTTQTSTTTTHFIRDSHIGVQALMREDVPSLRVTHTGVQKLAREPMPNLYVTHVSVQMLEANTSSTTTHFWEEDFEAMAAGNPPTGWTEVWATAPTTTVEKLYGKRALSVDISANARVAVTDDPIDKYNVEVLGLIKAIDDFSTLAGGVCGRVSGAAGTETGYVLFMDPANDLISLRRYKNGTQATLTTASKTIAAGLWYWMRLRINGTNIKARVWAKWTAEPGTWDIDYTDSSNPVSTEGGAGVCTYNADAYCDYFAAEGWDANWPIPLPSLTTTSTTSTTTTHTTTSLVTSTTTTGTTTTSEPGAQYWTDFSEHTPDTAPADWTEVWEAPVATIYAREDGQYGQQHLEIAHSTYGHYFAQWNDVPVANNVETLVKFKVVDAYPITGQDYMRLIVRQTGGSANKNAYELRIYPDNNNFKIYKWVNNVASQRGATGALTINSGTWYWARFQVIGNLLKARMWAGQPSDEPGAWGIETTDSAHAGVYGTVGLGGYNGSEIQIDYFAVGVGGDAAPAPADYVTTTTTTTTTTSTTTTGTTETPMEPATYAAVGVLQRK